jgi:hypothetical protein
MSFYPTLVPLMIQMKIQVLNLKTLKTQVPIGYLTLVKIIITPLSNYNTIRAE